MGAVDDVAGGGRCGANEGVGLFVGAGMARIGDGWAIVFDGDLAEVVYSCPPWVDRG